MHPQPHPAFPETPQAHYNRLCPCLGEPYDPARLAELASLMKLSETGPKDEPRTMPSGYLYFGQFVDHDLARDNTRASEATPIAERTENFRTPRLDLELLYGKGRAAAPELYHEDGRLRLGLTREVTLGDGTRFPSSEDDLCRDPDGTPRVIDSRSDENLIVAQMQVLWAKLHNSLLKRAAQEEQLLAGIPPGTPFERVGRLVTWIFQWVVLHDFLPSFVRNEVWDDVFEEGRLRLYPTNAQPSDVPFALPIEFTLAAFRFGHSMVRHEYQLTRSKNVKLETLLRMTNQGGGLRGESSTEARLPADFVVDWDFFFDGRTFLNHADPIDPFITSALHSLPGMSLPLMSLLRGSRMQLASGEELARHFGFALLPQEEIGASAELSAFFRDSAFHGRTPLWYYLLREAAVDSVYEAGPRTSEPMQKLGQLGSRIIVETFHQVLKADGDSMLHAGRNWRPPFLVHGLSETPRRLDSLPEIKGLVRSAV